jgi:DNA ligase-1
MDYSIIAETYEQLEKVPSKLKKTEILANLLKKTPNEELEKVVLLIRGTIFPGYSQLELGIADKTIIKSIAKSTGFTDAQIVDKFKKIGDLGSVAEECLKGKKQATLAKKKMTVDFVFNSLRKLADVAGEGSQDKKLGMISELIVSSKPIEARYIVRTILANLRVGASEGLIRDAIAQAFFDAKEKDEAKKAVENSLNIIADIGEVARIAKEKGLAGLGKSRVEVGKPIQVMLAEKEESIEKVLKKYKKVAIEWKFDGMRAQIHKKGDKIWIYTRRLEDVTKQFPDLVKLVKESVKADDCVIEGEVLGINSKTGEPLPFQILSQRVHRKYDIEKMAKEIPIQMNFFDAIYVDGELLILKPFTERRKILEKIVKPIDKKIQIAKQITTDDLKEAEKFYKAAIEARQEGVMLKVLDSSYVFGRHVDGWIKIKPVMETLDLVIIGATWGEGARANWLTSFVLACRDPKKEKLLECGMMSTGLTEEEYKEMTKVLKPLITSEKGKDVVVKPKVVVEVEYQEIQKSPNYSSGFALRFPAFKNVRYDKGVSDADTIDRVKKLYLSQGRAG